MIGSTYTEGRILDLAGARHKASTTGTLIGIVLAPSTCREGDNVFQPQRRRSPRAFITGRRRRLFDSARPAFRPEGDGSKSA